MSRNVIVRYRTRPDAADENSRLVRAVYAALAELKPEGFSYTTYALADGETFVHVAHVGDAGNPLATLPEFLEFQRDLADRCVEPPAPAEATIVGTYRSSDPTRRSRPVRSSAGSAHRGDCRILPASFEDLRQ